jgi:hypothetical protein
MNLWPFDDEGPLALGSLTQEPKANGKHEVARMNAHH